MGATWQIRLNDPYSAAMRASAAVTLATCLLGPFHGAIAVPSVTRWRRRRRRGHRCTGGVRRDSTDAW